MCCNIFKRDKSLNRIFRKVLEKGRKIQSQISTSKLDPLLYVEEFTLNGLQNTLEQNTVSSLAPSGVGRRRSLGNEVEKEHGIFGSNTINFIN